MSIARNPVTVGGDFRCPMCRSSTRTVPNPFFGTGLSVHRFVIQCRHCDWTHLVRDSASNRVTTLREQSEHPIETVEVPPSAWRRLLRRRSA